MRVAGCRACDGVTYTHALSPQNGPLTARVLFVAEAPGRRGAAVTGVPLTRDESGRRFEHFLAIAGLSRSEVFVTNSVLCHPRTLQGRNRTPTRAEIARCVPFLAHTLELVRAPVVVALGRTALDALRAVEPHSLLLAADVGEPRAWGRREIIALYHPGRQSTLHRPQRLQEEDWRGLGAYLARCHPAPLPATLPAG